MMMTTTTTTTTECLPVAGKIWGMSHRAKSKYSTYHLPHSPSNVRLQTLIKKPSSFFVTLFPRPNFSVLYMKGIKRVVVKFMLCKMKQNWPDGRVIFYEVSVRGDGENIHNRSQDRRLSHFETNLGPWSNVILNCFPRFSIRIGDNATRNYTPILWVIL